jgi:predicted membrane-bound spermidine synthase
VNSRPTVGIFVTAVVLNAALLFVLEPMFGKMALPLLGGSAAVWTTCMLFFQAALLGGYLYAHLVATLLSARAQTWTHAGLLLAAGITLPISIPHGWTPANESQPELSLLVLLTLRIGAPFILLAAGSPLFQHWFSRAAAVDDRDPYALYVASNLGSILALVAYPFAIEPWLTLGAQSRAWSIGYLALIVLSAWCGFLARGGTVRTPIAGAFANAITWRVRLSWIVLAAVPSSLLLGVTTHITTDLAPIPLLWVLPLAIYLQTFVIAFGDRTQFPAAASIAALPYLVISCAVLLFLRSELPGPAGYVVHLATFFVCALACHLRLAAARPPAGRLTEFYVWLSIGGVLGGLFNALLAPNVFHTVLEYPMALVAATALTKPARWSEWRKDLVFSATLGLALFAAVSLSLRLFGPDRLVLTAILTVFAMAAYSFRGRAPRLALGVGAIILAGSPLTRADGKQVLAARSFYGVYRVVDDRADRVREFLSGTTVHGAEWLNDTLHAPLAYYHRDGPLGSLFSVRSQRKASWRVGVIGLGVGATASYAIAGESWTFFELDPLVARIAENPGLFQYLTFASVPPRVVIGDARVSLERDSEELFDVLIIDAFSSDAIPTHLLTREAVSLYRSRLAPDGIIAWHISNEHVDLRPVLDALARDAGLIALIDSDMNVPHESFGRFPSIWVATTASDRTASAIRSDPGWLPLHTARPQLWTDDFSNLFRVLR